MPFGFSDKVGNDDERSSYRRAATRDAITRHAEVMDWVRTILTDPEHRQLLWHWAFSIVRGRSFAAWCKANGKVKRTAISRISRVFDLIASDFRRKGLFPTLPDAKWVFQIEGENGTHFDSVGEESAGGQAAPQIRSWADPSAPRSETILTPEAIAEFEKFMAKTNRRRRAAGNREINKAA
jgi:hypothetical protein